MSSDGGLTSKQSSNVIVCLHGLGRSSRDWDNVRSGLEQFGHVITPDLPKDPRQALRAAEIATPKGAILIGHSYGAVLAMQLAAKSGSSVRAVILTSSFFPPALNGRSFYASLADYLGHRVSFLRDLRSTKASSDPGNKNIRGLGKLLQIAIKRSAFQSMIRAINVPVLVIHSRDDHYVPVDFVEAAAADHPDWKLVVLPKGGHYPHRDTPKDWLLAATPWLNAL